jgi:hypothetical protein
MSTATTLNPGFVFDPLAPFQAAWEAADACLSWIEASPSRVHTLFVGVCAYGWFFT